jgi:hypothetical protein
MPVHALRVTPRDSFIVQASAVQFKQCQQGIVGQFDFGGASTPYSDAILGGQRRRPTMSDSDRLLEERNSLLKWHFEEGYKRVKATAAETARKLARFVALERYLNGQS